MPLEITYWAGSGKNDNHAGSVISSEQRTLSASSAQSGATPAGAVTVSIYATEAARFAYNGPSPTASSSSAYIGAGERIWIDAGVGNKIAGITA